MTGETFDLPTSLRSEAQTARARNTHTESRANASTRRRTSGSLYGLCHETAADLVRLAAKLVDPAIVRSDVLTVELLDVASRLATLSLVPTRSADIASNPDQEADGDVEPGKLLYTVAGAATRLGVSRTKAYELVRNGVLRTVEVGCRTMVPAAALAAYVDSLIERSA